MSKIPTDTPEQNHHTNAFPVNTEPDASADLVKIGEAAAMANVSERTLRYYEEIKLIKPRAHTTGGCRQYDTKTIERIIRIRELQELTSSNLEDIKSVLDKEESIEILRQAWKSTDNPEEKKQILIDAQASLAHLSNLINAKIKRLQEFETEIAQRLSVVEEMLLKGDFS
ncbi:MAG: MerR family transcriptional regulator [Firmicutes bacterium]|jgi:DNA-binding transcriptional MerR regulator|nr:MerR family transcriptional regulator [Bacillota bacterium]